MDDVYIRIVRAGQKGHGLRLSAGEVSLLMLDVAITEAAMNRAEERGFCGDCTYRRCRCRDRNPDAAQPAPVNTGSTVD